MPTDAVDRLEHIQDAISNIRNLIAGRSESDFNSDIVRRAALERFLEIVSEASRRLPQEWKAEHGPDVPWRDIANFGNVLRHVYQHVAVSVLWTICTDDLAPLEKAIEAMLAAHRT